MGVLFLAGAHWKSGGVITYKLFFRAAIVSPAVSLFGAEALDSLRGFQRTVVGIHGASIRETVSHADRRKQVFGFSPHLCMQKVLKDSM